MGRHKKSNNFRSKSETNLYKFSNFTKNASSHKMFFWTRRTYNSVLRTTANSFFLKIQKKWSPLIFSTFLFEIFFWTSKNQRTPFTIFFKVLSEQRASLLAPYGAYVLLEIFSNFILIFFLPKWTEKCRNVTTLLVNASSLFYSCFSVKECWVHFLHIFDECVIRNAEVLWVTI